MNKEAETFNGAKKLNRRQTKVHLIFVVWITPMTILGF